MRIFMLILFRSLRTFEIGYAYMQMRYRVIPPVVTFIFTGKDNSTKILKYIWNILKFQQNFKIRLIFLLLIWYIYMNNIKSWYDIIINIYNILYQYQLKHFVPFRLNCLVFEALGARRKKRWHLFKWFHSAFAHFLHTIGSSPSFRQTEQFCFTARI